MKPESTAEPKAEPKTEPTAPAPVVEDPEIPQEIIDKELENQKV